MSYSAALQSHVFHLYTQSTGLHINDPMSLNNTVILNYISVTRLILCFSVQESAKNVTLSPVVISSYLFKYTLYTIAGRPGN